MNPFDSTHFPKCPKYTRELCILTGLLGILCGATLLIKAPAWIFAMVLCMEFATCAIGIYRIESYYRSK